MSVCQQKCIGNASSRVIKAFKDFLLNEKQSTESHWNVSVPESSQGGSFFLTSYCRFIGSTPFKIARDNYSQQLKHTKVQVYAELIWQHIHSEDKLIQA